MRKESYRNARNNGWSAPRTFDTPQAAPTARAQHNRHDGRSDHSRWHWLLWIPVVLALMVPVYNRMGPSLFGVPFFYWWQLSLAGVCSIVVTVVHLATKDRA